MYRYFPTNYVWSLSVSIAMNCGGQIGEIDQISAPLTEIAKNGDDAGTEKLFQSWVNFADTLVVRAEQEVAQHHPLSAGALYDRASVYYLVAERMQRRDYEPRQEAYRKSVAASKLAIEHNGEPAEYVEIPYEGKSFPAIFCTPGGDAPDGGWPVMVFCNGLDSMKEMLYRLGLPAELARRGIATLCVDQPGTGASLRERDLPAIHDSERWAGAAVDYLETRSDVDPKRIGMSGISLGGYYAPRAAAFEKRFKLCAVWGANYNWGELQKRRLLREGENPVPHYWDHVQWVFGKDSLDEFMDFAPKMSLEGVVEEITVPFLVTHGEDDRQIPMDLATPEYERAINSPDRHWKLFSSAEGGSSHAGADNESVPANYIADWVADRL
ncbi:putative hydrolase, alpha/beta hydrolase family [Nocardia nova SH22a]|uniref:Putative hydrolase, alpha/beta hydrolase family n=1 Tax=Nocardia nova SH22a TaxID=1415166 RepID=W5TKB2_9NOCA|nr:alpha/beta fold hydrolase [Nocardia nova]AHH19805.1 putative hydrolase, alpha/beta hydrolase family [Nocardia nova SH22a]